MNRFVFVTMMLLFSAPALAAAPSYADKKAGRVAYSAESETVSPSPAYTAQSPASAAAIEPAAGAEEEAATAQQQDYDSPSSLSAERNRLPRKN